MKMMRNEELPKLIKKGDTSSLRSEKFYGLLDIKHLFKHPKVNTDAIEEIRYLELYSQIDIHKKHSVEREQWTYANGHGGKLMTQQVQHYGNYKVIYNHLDETLEDIRYIFGVDYPTSNYDGYLSILKHYLYKPENKQSGYLVENIAGMDLWIAGRYLDRNDRNFVCGKHRNARYTYKQSEKKSRELAVKHKTYEPKTRRGPAKQTKRRQPKPKVLESKK